MTDIEIASSCKMKLIKDVAKSVGIDELIENYGNYKAKINYDKINKSKNGKLVLVTSIHPTPYGEGKTTLSIGINDALRKIGKNSIVVLRAVAWSYFWDERWRYWRWKISSCSYG